VVGNHQEIPPRKTKFHFMKRLGRHAHIQFRPVRHYHSTHIPVNGQNFMLRQLRGVYACVIVMPPRILTSGTGAHCLQAPAGIGFPNRSRQPGETAGLAEVFGSAGPRTRAAPNDTPFASIPRAVRITIATAPVPATAASARA